MKNIRGYKSNKRMNYSRWQSAKESGIFQHAEGEKALGRMERSTLDTRVRPRDLQYGKARIYRQRRERTRAELYGYLKSYGYLMNFENSKRRD
jgi:hypothetical protein